MNANSLSLFMCTETAEEKWEILVTNSSKNYYHYWKLQAPDLSVLSMQFELTRTQSPWDNHTYLKVYDETLDRSEDLNMSAWANLIDDDGQI